MHALALHRRSARCCVISRRSVAHASLEQSSRRGLALYSGDALQVVILHGERLTATDSTLGAASCYMLLKAGVSRAMHGAVQAMTAHANTRNDAPASGQSAAAYAAAAVARRQLQTAGWAQVRAVPGCCWTAPLCGR